MESFVKYKIQSFGIAQYKLLFLHKIYEYLT